MLCLRLSAYVQSYATIRAEHRISDTAAKRGKRLLDLMNLAGLLVSPARLKRKRVVELNGLVRAIGHAAAAVPALIGVKDDGRLPFLGVGDENVNLANLNARIAAGALFTVDNDRGARRLHVRESIYFVSHFFCLLLS